MKGIWIIALNSFREFLRDRMVLVTGFVAVLLIVLSLLLGALSFGEELRIMAHLGLMAIHLAGLGIAVFLGSFVVHREMDRQTCLLVLARPIDRAQFIIGKFFGIVILNTCVWALLGVVLYALLGFHYAAGNYVVVMCGIWIEHTILAALAISLSTFLRPSISMFSVLTFFLAGHWLDDVLFFVKKYKMVTFVWTSSVIEKLIPNFYQMNWRSVYFLENGVIGSQVTWVLLHSLGWVLLLISLGAIVFRRKDLV